MTVPAFVLVQLVLDCVFVAITWAGNVDFYLICKGTIQMQQSQFRA